MGFNGTLDGIRIWRAALTENEVATAMSGKLSISVSAKNVLAVTWGQVKKVL